MKEGSDQDWLLGNPLWWPNSPVNERLVRMGDENPSMTWVTTTTEVGGRGWMRQRLQPVAPQILFTSAWSLFFIITSVIPLLFPNQTPIDDQNLAISFFLLSWFLLLFPFSWYSHSNSEGLNLFPLEFISFSIGIVFFLLHIAIDPILGWIGYLFFSYSWFKTVSNISDSLSVNSARWLLPISSNDVSANIFNEGWILSFNKFRNGLLASWSMDLGPYSAELTGLTFRGNKFIAFSMIYRGRIIHDPFNTNFIKNTKFDSILKQPPLIISGESWPQSFIQNVDEE